jgi:hypothetical protein
MGTTNEDLPDPQWTVDALTGVEFFDAHSADPPPPASC